MLVGNVNDSLRKLAIALRNLDVENIKEEVDDLDEIINNYYGSWIDKLPDMAREMYGLSSGEFRSLKQKEPRYKEFHWAGSGSFRVVMGLEGDDSFVIKLAKNAHGSQMNKSEFERQQEFEGMFPKVHHHGSKESSGKEERSYSGQGFDWIVVERVSPVSSNEELIEHFPGLAEALKKRGIHNIDDFGQNLGRFMHWNKGLSLGEEEYFRLSPYEFEKYIGKEVLMEILNEAKKDTMFNKLSYLAYKLSLDARDLSVGNLGINSANNLVIIDASLEEDFKSPYN